MKTTSATWTSRLLVAPMASQLCRWISRSRVLPKKSCRMRLIRRVRPGCTFWARWQVLRIARHKISDWAPTIITIKIDPEKIRDVIGKGGATIRAITEATGATIDIDNDGTVKIASVDGAAGREARNRIELITAEVEVGCIYEGRVARLMDFGAFVTILPGKDGLVHISQISDERVENGARQAQRRRHCPR